MFKILLFWLVIQLPLGLLVGRLLRNAEQGGW